MPKTLADITAQLDELSAQGQKALDTAQEDSTKVAEMREVIEGLQPQLAELTAARDAALREEEFKAMQGKMETLGKVIDDLRKPAGEFQFGSDEEGKAATSGIDSKYLDGTHSIFQDVRLAARGDSEAKARITEGFEGLNAEGKAMTEGTNAQGGYLVRPIVERQIVEAKELDNVLRGLCSSLNVTTNAIQLDQLALSTTAGWVAELAQKPESTAMTLASITASVFTAAGLVTVSNQLLADSNPAVDQLTTADLTKRLVALEETAFINGSGSGQPLGILNTPGLSTTSVSTNTIAAVVDKILTAIADVETNHGAPTAILMHPRTWTNILLSKDAAGAWLINPAAPGESAIIAGRTISKGPSKSLWGYPVVTSNRIPTNLGGGTESRIIVGDFSEALILDRQGITVDDSSHVYFTTNQTVFRAEERVGFTAARTPTAFNVVGGSGLAGL